MELTGAQWRSLGVRSGHWGSLKLSGDPWDSVGFIGALCGLVGVIGAQWESVRNEYTPSRTPFRVSLHSIVS